MIYVWLMHLHMAIQLHPHIPIQPIKVSSWALAASRPQRRIWAPHTPGSGVLGKQGATKRTWPYLFQYQHHGYNCQPDPHKNAALAFGTNLKQTIHSWEINIHQHDSKSTLCMHMFEKWYGTLVLLLSFANKCSSVAENLKLIPKQTTDGFWCFWVHDVTQKRTDLRISTPWTLGDFRQFRFGAWTLLDFAVADTESWVFHPRADLLQLDWTDGLVAGCFSLTRFIKLDKCSPNRFRMASSSIELSDANLSSKMVARKVSRLWSTCKGGR